MPTTLPLLGIVSCVIVLITRPSATPWYSAHQFNLVYLKKNNNCTTPGDIKPLHTSTPERKTQKKKEQDVSNMKTIRILNINFQSIRNKQGELINLIDSTKPDVFFGSETWLDPSIKDAQFFQEGYNSYRNDRNLNGGGVLIAVKDTYITSSVPELHKTVYICAYYNPKTANERGYDEFRISIERASNIRNAFIISAGDFNLPGWDWSQNIIKQNTQCIANHEMFADILDDNGMAQLVKQPTRGSNTLDLVVTNHPDSFRRVET
jgi:hypothetical protein